MATGLKEMLNPNVGDKIANVLESQAPLLLTSLFTNLYTTLGVSSRTSSSLSSRTDAARSSVSKNNNDVQQLTNSSTSVLMNAIRQSRKK